MKKLENLFKIMKEQDLNTNIEEETINEKSEYDTFLYHNFAKSGISYDTISRYKKNDYLIHNDESWTLYYPELLNNNKTDFYEIRFKNPQNKGKYKKPKGQTSRLFRPIDLDSSVIFDKNSYIIITEGAKKAIKAVQEGFPCLSISGVYNWKQNPNKNYISDSSENDSEFCDDSKKNISTPKDLELFADIIPDFKNYDYKDKEIILGYDADMWRNPKVFQALYQFAAYLISEKQAIVKILELPDSDAKGIDDFLVKYGREKFQVLIDKAKQISLSDIQEKLAGKKDILPFPIDIFPKNFSDLIKTLNKNYDAPIEYFACVFLSVISIIICGHYSIRIKNNSNWIEFPILWIMLIGKPSQKKTPCLNFGKQILDACDNLLELNYQDEVIKQRNAEYLYKKEMERIKKENLSVSELPQKPKPVHKARLTTQNTTIESLFDLINANKKYLLNVALYIDEITFLINSFNQYKHSGNDKQYFLQSWSKTRQNFVRKSTKTDYTLDVGHNIIGGIQPKVLYKKLFNNGIESDDGMIERWLYCCSKYHEKGYDIDETENPLEVEGETNCFEEFSNSLFHNIFDDFNKTVEYSFSPNAQKTFLSYCNEIIVKKKSNNINDLVKSYLQKQISYVARLSLIIHMFYDYKNPIIPNETVNRAIKVSKYFISCFLNIINEKIDVNPIEDVAINYLRMKNIKDISPTKLFKTNETRYKTVEKAKRVLENLAQKGYGRIIKASNGVKFVFYS